MVLYWLCEHTNLIKEEQHEDKIPIFLKWLLKKLHSSIKNRDLAKLKIQEVSGGELNQSTNEVKKFLMLREKLEKEAETQDTQVGEVFGTQLTSTQQTNTQSPDTQQLDFSQDTESDTLYSASRDEGIQVTVGRVLMLN
ncbi:hypothetical protein L1049_012460 [Liquidambar formosana]|uniref:Uncharacterized protein n=1 Tax=Liquidambar formosana TaxID=63359 RepID=A0AAP0N1K8_LIQFO